MSTELTVERVLELAEEAVAEYRADHTVDTCRIYTAHSETRYKTPSCLVGVILHKTVGDEDFQRVRDGAVLEPLDSLGLHYEGPVVNFLAALQNYQDGADSVHDELTGERWLGVDAEYTGDPRPWGDAVEFVKANLETIVNHKTGEVA